MNTLKKLKAAFWIDPNFQLKIMFLFNLMTAITLFLIFLSLLYFLENFKSKGLLLGIPFDHVYFQFLNEEKSFLSMTFVTTSLFCLFISSFGGLISSYKIIKMKQGEKIE